MPPRDQAPPRLIIVSNRLPFTVAATEGMARLERSAGGLASGMRHLHDRGDALWIGWSGDLDSLSEERAAGLKEELASSRFVHVSIPAVEQSVFYDEISNGVLWPICHDRLD